MTSDPLILVVNAGTSSLKLTVFVGDRVNQRAAVERTNQVAVKRRFWIIDWDEKEVLCGTLPAAEHSTLLQVVLDTAGKRLPGHSVAAIGHGGDQLTTPVRVKREVLSALESLAPLHQPHNLAKIRAVASLLPDVPQVACLSTRPGAIDPGVVLYQHRNDRLTPDHVERLLDRESGLLGMSGISSHNWKALWTNHCLQPISRTSTDIGAHRTISRLARSICSITHSCGSR